MTQRRKLSATQQEMVATAALAAIRSTFKMYVIKGEDIPVDIARELLEKTSSLTSGVNLKQKLQELGRLMQEYSQQARMEAIARSKNRTP